MAADTVLKTCTIANSSLTKLLDSALFRFAHELWLAKYRKDLIFREFRFPDRIRSVSDYFSEHYADTPTVIQRQIINVIRIIGHEIEDFIVDSRRINCCNVRYDILNLTFDQLCWTSQFTIDRLKTMMHGQSDFVEGYECPKWVKKKWDSKSADMKLLMHEAFGKYSIIVFIFYEICIVSFLDFESYLTVFSSYLDSDTHEERTFKFFILNGNIECFDYFRNKVPPERHREIVSNITESIITRSYSSQWHLSEHTLVRIAVYFWNYLDQEDKCRVVQRHFSEFYEFLLYSPGTESLIPAIEWYKPSKCTRRENRSYLERTAQRISSDLCEGQRYRCMFRSLYKIVRTVFSTIDILNLLEIILVIEDIETASMMVRMMDDDKRAELLSVIPKVWHDLWKTMIERETFFAFFFEVQSYIFRAAMRNN